MNNVVARLSGDIERRADVVDTCPNETAIRGQARALLMERNDEDAIQKRYISLESIPGTRPRTTRGTASLKACTDIVRHICAIYVRR